MNLLPSHIPAVPITAHLSSRTGTDMSSNRLASGVLGVIVTYEIRAVLTGTVLLGEAGGEIAWAGILHSYSKGTMQPRNLHPLLPHNDITSTLSH